MKVTETELPDGGYEQRYSLLIGKVVFGRFVRRPVRMPPPEGFVGIADDGPRRGLIPHQGAAHYRGGRWSGLKFEPTHWTAPDVD